MHKRIFAAGFLLLCFFVFVETQVYFIENNSEVLGSKDKESLLEAAFPCDDIVKEIYGFSNKLLSPNEKVEGATATIKEQDGYLQTINMVETEVVDRAKFKISELNDICHQNETEFSFIFYPSKSNSSTVPEEYGVDTNYEEVRADFISYLDAKGLDYLNIRELLENEGYTVNDVFYKTDHHWKTPFGFYAAHAIGDYLNDRYDWKLDVTALDEDKFTFTTYENLWLGETGRDLSKTWAGVLDDFMQIMPNYETSISLYYPDGSEVSGDFSILIDDAGYDSDVDYYSYSAHYSYARGMGSQVTYHNNFADGNGKRILIIKDSFSVVVIPFLTLETSDVTVWDMREEAQTSLYQYIQDNDFDVVLMAYTDFWRSDMWNFN